MLDLASKAALRLTIAMLVAPVLALIPASQWSADGASAGSASQTGALVRSVAIESGYAYVAAGSRLVILDISEPRGPVVVGQTRPLPDYPERVPQPRYARRLVVDGSRAYLQNDDLGLHIVDVSDPGNPHEIGAVRTFEAAFADDWAVGSNYVYLAATAGRPTIIDVSDPGAPTEVGSLPTSSTAVTISGAYAYVGAGTSIFEPSIFQIIDVSNPIFPVELGAVQIAGKARQIVRSGSHAFVAVEQTISPGDEGLRIIDISEAVAPREIGFYHVPRERVRAIIVSGDYAYVGVGPQGTFRIRRIHIVDVSDPALPRQVGVLECHPEPSERCVGGTFAVSANHLYLAAGALGLRVFDLTDPAMPSEVASVAFDES